MQLFDSVILIIAVGPPLKLEPVSWFGYGITLIAVLLSFIDILRAEASSNYGFDVSKTIFNHVF